MMAGAQVENRKLPSKEAALFKQILRMYEFKQYKRGLKCAETILKKCPTHGETLAMKGLFLSHLDAGNNAAAYDHVKQGLRHDLFSPICWHVYGLLYRSDKNYEEAMKCYRHALKYDKENIQVLRDFSLIQIQMRDFEGFNNTKHELLRLRPNQRVYWIGLAISYHMLKDFKNSLKVLDVYETACQDRKEGVLDFEHSELMLYRGKVLEESGDYQGVLDHLIKVQEHVCDKVAWNEKHAEMLLKVGKSSEARKAYEELMLINAENIKYLRGLQASAGVPTDYETITDEQSEQALILFTELQAKYPRSQLCKREALNYARGDQFRRLLDEYLKPMFRKGVPSLFVSLKRLYSDPKKIFLIEQLVESYANNLLANVRFSNDGAAEDKEPPSAYMWVMYFLAQHYDRQLQTEKAVQSIEAALQHTPTLLELVMLKARIYKHGGSLDYAAFVMNDARELDLQDRFINSKSTKYHVRNDDVERAEKCIALFAREGSFEEKMHDLVEMQCMWFALEVGRSYARQGQNGKALKRFHQIAKYFEDFTDDQFDFHTYCLRKMTLRSYVDLLRFEDELRGRKEFVNAAVDAIKIYLQLADNPTLAVAELNEIEFNKVKLEKEKSAAKKKSGPLDAKKPPVKDEDVFGVKYLKDVNFLEEAKRFVRLLQKFACSHLSTHLMAGEVYLRQKKYLLALKALTLARRMDAIDPEVHSLAIKFWQAFLSSSSNDGNGEVMLSLAARELIEEEMQREYPLIARTKTTAEYNQHYLDQAVSAGNAAQVIKACELLLNNQEFIRDKELQAKVSPTLLSLATDPRYRIEQPALLTDKGRRLVEQKFTVGNAQRAFHLLRQQLNDRNDSTDLFKFRSHCNQLFPLATEFMSTEQLAAVKQQQQQPTAISDE